MTSFCFDLDGTICTNTHGAYEDAEPYPWAVLRVQALAAAGHSITIMTARGSGTGIDWGAVTRGQLERWGVPYDELRFGKPSSQVFVDDRAFPAEHWRWGHTTIVPSAACTDETLVEGMRMGIAGLAPPLDVSAFEVGRTYGGRALWADEHVAALLARVQIDRDPATLVAAVRQAAESPGGVIGDAGEVIFTLAVAATPHIAYADVYAPEAYPAVAISCRALAQLAPALQRVDTVAELGGTHVFSLAGDTVTGPSETDVTTRAVVASARAAGFAVVEGTADPAAERFLVSAPLPLLPLAEPSAELRRLAEAFAAGTGVDPLTELARLR